MFEDLIEANRAYAQSLVGSPLSPRAAKGLAVITCMDARIDPAAMLGLSPGDAIIIRNAGARVTPDVVPALVIARHLLGVNRAMMIAHTGCRMVADDDAQIRDAIRQAGGPSPTDLRFGTVKDQMARLRADVQQIRDESSLAGIEVAGFRYDLRTGEIAWIC